MYATSLATMFLALGLLAAVAVALVWAWDHGWLGPPPGEQDRA